MLCNDIIDKPNLKFCCPQHKRKFYYYKNKGLNEKEIQQIYKNRKNKKEQKARIITLSINSKIKSFFDDLSSNSTRTNIINELIKNNFYDCINYDYYKHLGVDEPKINNFSTYLYLDSNNRLKKYCVENVISFRLALKMFLYNYYAKNS